MAARLFHRCGHLRNRHDRVSSGRIAPPDFGESWGFTQPCGLDDYDSRSCGSSSGSSAVGRRGPDGPTPFAVVPDRVDRSFQSPRWALSQLRRSAVRALSSGICVGGFWAFAANVGRRLVSGPYHNRATAIILAGISAGTVCGLPAGTWVGTVTTWRTAFDINCLLAVLVLMVQALSLPSLPADQEARWVELAAPFRLPEVRTALICTFLIIVGYFVGYTYLTPFIMLAFHLSLSSVPVLLLAYGVAGLVGTFIAERLMRQGPRRALLWVSIILVSAMYLGAHIGSGFVSAMLFAVLIGAAFGALPMALATWIFHATPDHAEAGQVLLVVIFQLAIAAGSAMGGFVVSHGGIAATMTAGAAAVFLGALASNPLHKAEGLSCSPPAPI